MAKNDSKEILERELKLWPGVKYRYERRSKHIFLLLDFRGKEQFIVIPVTSRSNTGILNSRTQLRHKLKEMGVEKNG